MNLSFQLAARELSVAGLKDSFLSDSFMQARSRAAEVLSAHLGEAWRRIQEPAKTVLFEAESLYQLQAPVRLGAPVAIVPAYMSALEGWLRTVLGGDQSLAGYGHDLRKLGRYTDRFEVPSELQTLYGRVSTAREFWCDEIPAAILDSGVYVVRNRVVHVKRNPTWDDLEFVRNSVLGDGGQPGLIARAPNLPPLR